MPFLIFLGLPPHFAIGTHRLATVFGSIVSIRKYLKSGKIIWKYVITFTLLSVIIGILGVQVLFSVNAEIASNIVGVGVLLPLPLLFLKEIGIKQRSISSTATLIGYVLYALLSFWGGMFGPGSKTMFLYLLTFVFGFTFIQALATRVIPAFFSRIVIFLLFANAGMVNWTYGFFLVLGYIVGCHIGVDVALRKGNEWIRLLLTVVVVLSSLKLILF